MKYTIAILIILLSNPAQSLEKIHTPALDVLFIIDNSPSIKRDGGDNWNIPFLFANNADFFIKQLSDIKFLDYRIGVAGSSAPPKIENKVEIFRYGSHLARCVNETGDKAFYYVERSITHKESRCLMEMMNRITTIDGAPIEKFLSIPLLIPLNFHRSKAHLAAFATTDAEDQSDFSPEEAYRLLVTLKGGDKRKVHYSVLGSTSEKHPSGICESEHHNGAIPHKLIKMTDLSGGDFFNLCDFNYGRVLFEFAKRITKSVLTVSLDSLPNTDTLEVRYHNKGKESLIPRDPLTGWTYNEKDNVIHLSRHIPLEPGGEFKINYTPL